MSDNVVAMHGHRASPLKIINPAEWQGKAIPNREWLINGIAIRGGITLLNGDGGTGKSLLCMQLQTALALGKPWLGIQTPFVGTRSLALYCEDEPDELQRRQSDINKYYGCDMKDLDGMVSMISRVGQNNTLMSFRRGAGEVTGLYRQIEEMISLQKIDVVIIDTAADTFGGKEIDREEVRTFIQTLRKWALQTRGAVIITQHPSVTGMQTGTGASGSTGWNNSVRSRLYLTQPKRVDDDGDEIPTDERVLKCMKSNYGPKGGKVRLVWSNGVMVPLSMVGPQSIFDAARTREALVYQCEQLIQGGQYLAADPQSKASLVTLARSEHPELRKLSFTDVRKAQEDLVRSGELLIVRVRKADRHHAMLIRSRMCGYSGEQAEGNQ